MKLTEKQLRELLVDVKRDQRGDNLYCKCPWCGFDEFGISLSENHKFNCFRKKKCGVTGNIYTLLAFLKKYNFFQRTFTPQEKLQTINKEEEQIEIEVNTIKPPIGFTRVFKNNYLEKRNFTEFEKYKIGTTRLLHSFRDYIIFLIEENNELKGYVGRYTGEGEVKKKYNNSISDFSKLVLGLDELSENTKAIIVVEGLFDKISVDKKLNLSDEEFVKCVCTFGAKFSDIQMIKVKIKAPNIEDVFIMHESDVLNIVKKTALRASNFFENVKVCYLPEKDPDEMTKEEIEYCLENAKDPIDFKISKVRLNSLN